MPSLSDRIRDDIIVNLLLGNGHRDIVQDVINTAFLDRTVSFFKKVIEAKLNDHTITDDWYKENMMNKDLDKDEIAWNSGLSLKSIGNIHGSQSRNVVIRVSRDHYDQLLRSIHRIIENDDIDITLTLTLKKISIELSIHESLIVINAIAVMRGGVRGGAWSSAGKKIEKPLIETICRILRVDPAAFEDQSIQDENNPREADFVLVNSKGELIRCEIKLMGNGNPESADGAMARGARLFLADKLSDQNKSELDKLDIKWIAMADGNILEQFSKRLDELGVDNVMHGGKLDEKTIRDVLSAIE